MGKGNIYLVDLGTGNNMNLLPLAIAMVGSYSTSQDDLKELYNIEYRFLRYSHETSMINPIVVGFSCYIWNYHASLVMAKEVKRKYPQALIVLGGYSVPKRPHRIAEFFTANPYVDFLIHGEGELTFANLLRELAGDRCFENIKGLTFQNRDVEEGFLSNPIPERIQNLDDLPPPFLNGVFDQMIKQYGSSITGALWESNRGCPYSCTFCDWGNSDVSKLKKFDMDRLYQEINWISNNGFYYIFLADANFGIFRQRDLEIAGWIADLNQKNGSPRHFGVNWKKSTLRGGLPRIANTLQKGGVTCNITLSLQSTNQDTLKAIKRSNLPINDFYAFKSSLHDQHLHTYTELILGLPLETYDSFATGINQVMSPRLEGSYCIYLCQMLENTELNTEISRKAYQIETRLCKSTVTNRRYQESESQMREIEEFVVATSTMSLEEWKRAYLMGYSSIAMYNHRIAFFVMNYLRSEHGKNPIEFIEFLIDCVLENSVLFPRLYLGLSQIMQQRSLVLDGTSAMRVTDDSGGLTVVPQVAAVISMVKESQRLYEELRKVVVQFCDKNDFLIQEAFLDDLIVYQQVMMPSWPIKHGKIFNFKTNIPEYFQCLVHGLETPDLKYEPMSVRVSDHSRNSETFIEFAATLVRGNMTVDTLEAEIISSNTHPKKAPDSIFENSGRRAIEQAHIHKVAEEFEKLTRNSWYR